MPDALAVGRGTLAAVFAPAGLRSPLRDLTASLGTERPRAVGVDLGRARCGPPGRRYTVRRLKTAASAKNPVATRAMAGPEGRSAWKER